MNGLADSDVDAMVSSFAVETYVEHFDLRAYLELVRVYSVPGNPLLVPAETPFSASLGVEQRHSSVIDQILFQYLALVDPKLDLATSVNVSDETVLDEFYSSLGSAVSTLDTTEVASFTFVPLADVDAAAAEDYESEQNQANLDSRREEFSAPMRPPTSSSASPSVGASSSPSSAWSATATRGGSTSSGETSPT